MSKKTKLSQLHRELLDTSKIETQIEPKKVISSEVNPARGKRGNFLKVTITFPPNTLGDLKRLAIDRKLKGEKDTDVSSLIRESLKTFLEAQE